MTPKSPINDIYNICVDIMILMRIIEIPPPDHSNIR